MEFNLKFRSSLFFNCGLINFPFLEQFPNCNVEEYFSCVGRIKKWGDEGGFATYDCNTPCEQIDYIAWQDMNELPGNIFPKIMESDTSFEQNQELSSESDDEEEDVSVLGLPSFYFFSLFILNFNLPIF